MGRALVVKTRGGLGGSRAGLEVCGAVAGSISQIPAVRGDYCGCRLGAEKKFQAAHDSGMFSVIKRVFQILRSYTGKEQLSYKSTWRAQ